MLRTSYFAIYNYNIYESFRGLFSLYGFTINVDITNYVVLVMSVYVVDINLLIHALDIIWVIRHLMSSIFDDEREKSLF